MRAFAIAFLALAGTTALAVEECPSSIQYQGGRLLKSGETYYYPSGKLLRSGSSLYYPDGRLLRSGSTFYYPSGKLLKSGNTLYYPNGRLLKSGNTFYYANGRLLRSGSTFYYEDGRLARSGSTLYRPDGSITAFPVRLQDKIEEFGEIRAFVEKSSEQVDVLFYGLLLDTEQVKLSADWDGSTFSRLEFFIYTGYDDEVVGLSVTEDAAECRLLVGGHPGESFTISGRAATIDVRVNPGYDAIRVSETLKEALDSIR